MVDKLADSHKRQNRPFGSLAIPRIPSAVPTGDGVLNCRVRHGTGWTHSLVTHRINNTKNDPKDFLRAVLQINSSGDLLSHGYPP